VYFAKASEGMTRLWPTLGVVVTILLTQFLVARVMSSGGQVAAAIVAVVVAVIVGAGLIGYFVFGERLSALQIAGGTQTAAADAMADTEEMKAFVRNMHALKRIAAPEEQARAALFLASDAAAFITGSAMLVDGGVSINKT
jgi:enoyl-[acyl-carrier-protein] reductase (NADH)